MDMQSYFHLEKMQGTKEIKGLESSLAVWDNLMLNFQCPPKPAHMYTAFLSKIRNIPGLQETNLLEKMDRLPWGDPIPGHALHEKGLQRQIGVGPLVGSQEERALLVPLKNRG